MRMDLICDLCSLWLVCIGWLETVFAEITLSFDGSLTARSSGRDGLTLERICNVPSSEDTWDLGAWRSSLCLDVADFVTINPWSE